jgi:hypothetical protein
VGVARTWLSIEVDLVSGRGRAVWPRPGRIFAAARSHTFAELAEAIDTAFSRWDRSHLTLFELQDATEIYGPIEWEEPPPGSVFGERVRLSRLQAGEQFLYTFDMGDDWTHLCTVGQERIDPRDHLGIVPDLPLPYWGWGDIPDQYDRRFQHDDGETPLGPNPELQDLPPLSPFWGPQHR